ncbi:hypothetical protein K4F52_004686 [Lecanicillium sp. MT-2017a]|nr:hypothetical protein K4F52_004686 [Lecanicillium sp. MT-2017a]
MGNFAFDEPLREDMNRYRNADDTLTGKPLFAMGSIPDRSDQAFSRQVSVLATAAGESGELLRLAVAQDTRWQWGEDRDAFLNLSVVDPLDTAEEVTWACDGLPITQVKYAEGLSNQDYVRWIFVQRQTSTTVLQPEYSPVPLSGNQADDAASHQIPSYIQPNPILTLQHSDTGGNAHSDIVFSPAAYGHKPMIAVIDECGYWSIWNILGTRRPGLKTARLSRRVCGHINDGVFTQNFPQTSYPALRHGLVAVPNRNATKNRGRPALGKGARPPTGPTLIMWRGDKMEAIDMHTGANASPTEKFWTAADRSTQIFDVQRCPAFEDRIFVLTDQSVLWMRVDVGKPLSNILICPHGGTVTNHASMTLCQISDTTVMAFVISTQTGQLSVYWFENNSPAGVPQWQKHITSIPAGNDFQPDSRVHQISITPARLLLDGETSPSGLGSLYYREGIEFYQVNIFGVNLSMRYGIYTTNCNSNIDMALPTKRLGWSTTEQRKRWKRKRKNFVRYFGTAFVLPDGVTDDELSKMLARNQGTSEELLPPESVVTAPKQPLKLNLEKFCQNVMQKMTESLQHGERGLPKDLFEAIRDMFSESSRLPLLTWYELFNQVGEQAILEPIENGMESEVENLIDQTDGNRVITQVRRFGQREGPDSLMSLSYLYKELSDLWLEPVQSTLSSEVQAQRRIWVAEVARDMFLSGYAVMIQDVPMLGPSSADEAHYSGTPASPAMPPSSPASMRSTPPAASPGKTDAAVDRLRLLAGSMEPGELGTTKSLDLLSYWPTERGVDTQDYISSVSLATDDKFREARERLQRKEARLKSHVDKFRRLSAKRQSMGPDGEAIGFSPRPAVGLSPRPPPVQIMSSQQGPSSSQTQAYSVPPVTMSQPVSGAFGDRKKTKKPKRKSGFR